MDCDRGLRPWMRGGAIDDGWGGGGMLLARTGLSVNCGGGGWLGVIEGLVCLDDDNDGDDANNSDFGLPPFALWLELRAGKAGGSSLSSSSSSGSRPLLSVNVGICDDGINGFALPFILPFMMGRTFGVESGEDWGGDMTISGGGGTCGDGDDIFLLGDELLPLTTLILLPKLLLLKPPPPLGPPPP